MQKFIWLIIYLSFFNNHCFLASISDKQPLLVVTIMVKNEAPVMEATLKPFLQADLQYYLILDTGSTDNTVQVVRDLFQKYKIKHGHIVEQPFVNFAVSRNYALECAEKIFPHAVFFLMIDAEWYMHNVEGLLKFCEKNQNNTSKAFFIKRFFATNNAIEYCSCLFKAHQGVQYVGAVHECINQATYIKVPDEIFISVEPSQTGNEKSSRRWHRDVDILLKEHQKNPSVLRTMFYLGQTYACLHEFKQALFWYGKRCHGQANDEEKYLAHVRKAVIYQLLGNGAQALFYYFKAYSVRPQRIETLVTIAQYYFNIHDYASAFLLAKYTATIPVSYQETSIELKTYNFTRYDIVSKAAWYVGEYEIGRQATIKALEYDPFNIDLLNKLKLYEDALNHKNCNLLNRNFWCQWCNGNLWLSRPTWFNFCCLAHGCYQSNRCNFSQGLPWRYWVGPFNIESSI